MSYRVILATSSAYVDVSSSRILKTDVDVLPAKVA